MLGRRKAKLSSEKPENDKPAQENEVNIENHEVDHEEIIETDSIENDIPESDESYESNEISEPDEITDTGAEEPEGELSALQKELEDLKDKRLRMAAEFDNYRKRTNREKMDLIQTAGESLLKDILPFVDDFDRGIEMAANAEDMDAIRTGMDLIYSKLKDFLTNHGIKEINAMNEPFSADWHEAITKIPAATDDMKGKIVDVIQKGYTLNDKIIRYPKVVVGE
jgi:molecular chaperone GrpE